MTAQRERLLVKHDFPREERLSRLLLSMVRHANEPSELVRQVCRYLGAVCGVLWLRDTYTQDEFKVYAHYNRPDFGDVDDIYFSLRDENIVAAQTFLHRRPIFGLIGEPPFSGPWLQKHYTKALSETGAKFIIVSPISDSGHMPYGVLSLYFAHVPANIPRITNRVSLVNEAIHVISTCLLGEVDLVVGERRKMGHEIISGIGSIRRSLVELQTTFNKDGLRNSERRAEYLADIKSSVDQIEESTKHYRFIDSVRELRKRSEFILFRSEFNSTAQPLIKQQPILKVSMSPLRMGPGEPSVLVARPHLRELIANLVGNAIKYSVAGGTVTSEIRRVSPGVIFQISNLSHGIPLDERKRIWTYRYRGSNVAQTEIPGDGIGLNVVKDICDVYGLQYEYNEEQRMGTNLIWSRFLITFPEQLVSWGRSERL